MRLLLTLFVLVPIIELYLLIGVGGVLGFWPTLGVVLLTGVVGAGLARREGFRVLAEWQEAMATGRMPTEGVIGGLLVLAGGLLLITPGILTDVVGFSLMMPAVRRVAGVWLKAFVVGSGHLQRVQVVRTAPWSQGSAGRSARGNAPRVIDVEGEVISVDGKPTDERPSHKS